MTTPSFDDIPTPEPLPESGGGEGPGLTQDYEKDDRVKLADYVGQVIGVLGFVTMKSQYYEKPGDPEHYTLVEFMDKDGACALAGTTSRAIRDQLIKRWERNEIPFRSLLVERPTKKNPNFKYYSFG